MKKTVFILVICIAVILIVGCQKKEAPAEEEVQAEVPAEVAAEEEVAAIVEQEEITVEISLIEKVAKIAAMFEVDPVKGAVLLEEADLSKDDYETALADIALDEEATKLFVEKKAEYIAEFQK